MSKEFDTMYIDHLVDRDYPPMSMDGMQLAAADTGRLPEVVVTGEPEKPTGAGGLAGVPKPTPKPTKKKPALAPMQATTGEIKPIQPSGAMGALKTVGEMIQSGAEKIDFDVLGFPGIGTLTLKDLTVGDLGKVLVNIAEGFPPVTGSGQTLSPTIESAELLNLAPLATTAYQGGKALAKGVVSGAKSLAPVAGEMVEGYMRKTGSLMDVAPPGPNVVSTRLPTAVKATEDPIKNRLVIDYAAAKSDPVAFSHNVGLIKEYPNFVSKARTPDKQAEDFVSHVKDNLLYLYDQVPEQTRQRSKLWYNGARNITDKFSADYGIPDQAVSGVLAVLSPQKDWFMNVSLGQRVIDIARNQANHSWDDAMEQTASRIFADPKYKRIVDLVRGKSFSELKSVEDRALWLRTYDQAFNPANHRIVMPEGDFGDVRLNQDGSQSRIAWGSLNEIGKAISILEDPSLVNISTMLGEQHKVRNFYNNIYAPDDPAGHVTIDTHAVAAGLLRPLSGNSREVKHNFGTNVKGEVGPKNSSVNGVQGTYGIFAEAYRRAAAERGVLPREMQSITWEAVRGLFPDTFKTAKNSQVVDDIWLKYRKGKLSLEEARNEVIRTAGGIRPPEWERSGLRGIASEEGRVAADTGELPGASVSGGGAGGSGRIQPAGTNKTGVTRSRPAPKTGAE
jgi:hypothetical protein